MHLHHYNDGTSPATPWPAAGSFGAFRTWDSPIMWYLINTANGVYDWTKADAIVTQLTAQSIKVHLCLGATPNWASARPAEAGPYGNGTAAEPANMASLSAFVTAFCQRYAGKVAAIEVWNEANTSTFYTGSVATLVTIASTIRSAARAVDTSIQIVGPSVVNDSGFAYLNSFFSAGGGAQIDVVGNHFYNSNLAPENDRASIMLLRSCMDRWGLSALPLWDTENGWTSVLTTAQQRGYPVRLALIEWLFGVQALRFYAWDNDTYTTEMVSSADHKTLTASGTAWVTAQGWLVGRTTSSYSISGTVWTVTLDNGTHIVWDTSGSSTFNIPAWGATTVKDLAGGSSAIGGATTWTIDEAPRLFV